MKHIFAGSTLEHAHVRIIDLAQPLYTNVPSSPNHPGFRQALLRRHGDEVRVDGTSGASDIIIMGTHTGTHIDALSHVSHDGLLHGGVSAQEAQRTGSFSRYGAETLEPMVVPGIILDVAGALGVARLEPGQPITAADLERSRLLLDGDIPTGAAVLIRTGWAQLWSEPEAFLSHGAGVPGPNADAAGWLLDFAPRVVGSDTTAFEHIKPANGHRELPVHKLVIVDNGIPIIEMLNLETAVEQGALRHTFFLAPMAIVGATGSPVRPLAIVAQPQG